MTRLHLCFYTTVEGHNSKSFLVDSGKVSQEDYLKLPSGIEIKQIATVEDIKGHKGAQIVQHELWNDSHLNLLLQSKYLNLYTKKQVDIPKLKLD